MAAYKGFTEAQAKAHKKYMKTVATIQVRTTGDHRDKIKSHADSMNESVNEFIKRAINETMERDLLQATPEGNGAGGSGLGDPQD